MRIGARVADNLIRKTIRKLYARTFAYEYMPSYIHRRRYEGVSCVLRERVRVCGCRDFHGTSGRLASESARL